MPHTTRNSQQAGFGDIFTLLDPSGNSTPATQSTTHPPTPSPMSTSHHSSAHIDPNVETPDDTASEAQKFAEAIGKLVKLGNSAKPKLREPDPFNGSDSCKLRTFILQCRLNFRDCPDIFEDDKYKVNYVLSYLKGTALYCFESVILGPNEPPWASNF